MRARQCGVLCRACHAQLEPLGAGCPRCGEPGRAAVCARCRATSPPFGAARACFLYGDDALGATLVRRWKYLQDHVVGSSLCTLLRTHRKWHSECYDVVVPVPLHASRLATRGFNQAALLARAAAKPGERVVVDALRRDAVTVTQSRLGRRDRAANVADAFTVARPATVRDRTVLLIDDVLTTGATARACAAALRDGGATQVDVWTLARTPARHGVPAPEPS